MNDEDGARTAREWLAVRIVVLGGFAIAILVALYVVWSQHEQAQSDSAPTATLRAETQAFTTQARAKIAAAAKRAGAIVCLRETVNAQNIGIVPIYARPTDYIPRPTNTHGQYVCDASTHVAKYVITGNLLCRDLKDAKCLAVVSVKRSDGALLYQSQK